MRKAEWNSRKNYSLVTRTIGGGASIAVTTICCGSRAVRDRQSRRRNSPPPADFARDRLGRKTIYPLAEYGSENLLQPGLNIGSPVERALVRHIPLVFPLPAPLDSDVSDCMRRAVRTARIQHPTRVEDVVLGLNALSDGLAEGLQGWLEIV